MTPISATPGTEAQATFEPDFEELDDEEDAGDDPLEPDDEDEPFDEPDDDDESLDDEDAPAFSVFLSPEPEPDPDPEPDPGSEPDLLSEDAGELESEVASDFSLVLPLRESVR